ncbi:SUMF1/EgtB/PvdO family nonheme iron enzyme [bacterium]|nr:SUMF1/EgtB/PvdO family nonheme iron enzyme [bacterium]
MEFKLIPAGTFTMGEDDEAHEVTLTQPFQMGVHEVTQAQYKQVMGVNPSIYKGSDDPVDEVSWTYASLLHVPIKDLDGVMVRLFSALRPNGIFHSSFKEGRGERMEGDRLFVDFTEMGLGDLLKQQPCVANVRTWTTTDLR